MCTSRASAGAVKTPSADEIRMRVVVVKGELGQPPYRRDRFEPFHVNGQFGVADL
jgi:hypothetical protein